MKAMILAAGFGTRLRPLTEMKPKALMPVANKPILARNIEYLISHGITEIIVNAHHHHQQIVDYLREESSIGLNIEVKVEQEILGTGGGIKNAEDFWDKEPFFVINSDILTDIDLAAVYQVHQTSGALVTLVLHDCEPYNQVQVDEQWNITDIAKANMPGRLCLYRNSCDRSGSPFTHPSRRFLGHHRVLSGFDPSWENRFERALSKGTTGGTLEAFKVTWKRTESLQATVL